MSYPVISTTANIGALSGATRLLFPAPSAANGGGITVRAAYVNQGGAGSASLILTKGTVSSGGTFTANGTVSSAAIGGTANNWATGVVQTFAIGSTNFVSAGEWLAVAATVGACDTVSLVTVEYEAGR